MTGVNTKQIIAQLDDVLKEFETLEAYLEQDNLGGLAMNEVTHFITRARAVVHRVAGRPSVYVDQCEEFLPIKHRPGDTATCLAGVVESLRSDVAAGYLESQRELIHCELFADFLEMAQHLLDEGYKDPAAVVAGSSLEAHLLQLCEKAEIDTDVSVPGSTRPKKADQLNADLVKDGVYPKLDQKNVTAWLDLRNKAAHGHYDQYEAAQVGLMISSVRDFIVRNPA